MSEIQISLIVLFILLYIHMRASSGLIDKMHGKGNMRRRKTIRNNTSSGSFSIIIFELYRLCERYRKIIITEGRAVTTRRIISLKV